MEVAPAWSSPQLGQTCYGRRHHPCAHGNALAEAFFATLDGESLERCRCHADARMAPFHVIGDFPNPTRHHPALGDRLPIAYEARNTPMKAG